MMTEAEWLASDDVEPMLDLVLEQGVADRKLRLFACACCRRVWRRLHFRHGREVIEVAERFADALATAEQLQAASDAAEPDLELPQKPKVTDWERQDAVAAARYAAGGRTERSIGDCVVYAARAASDRAKKDDWDRARATERAMQASLLRDIVNPFSPGRWNVAWRAGEVTALALASYEERQLPAGTLDTARLTVLADALEEAGCANEKLLKHLRGAGPHFRGCWAVDLVIAKK